MDPDFGCQSRTTLLATIYNHHHLHPNIVIFTAHIVRICINSLSSTQGIHLSVAAFLTHATMNRLFGSKAAKPKPSLTDAIASTETRADSVEVKIRKLDSELTRYRDQMRKMRDGPGKTAIQQRALRVLKQKRLYENQLAQLQQQSYNMEQATMTTENLRNTMATFDAMQTANKEMKKTYGKIDLDKIESMQDEMEDLIEAANEVQETLGRSYGVPDEVDEEDLQAELDALEAEGGWEEEGESMPSYLQSNQELPDFVDELPNEGMGAGENKEQEQALRAA